MAGGMCGSVCRRGHAWQGVCVTGNMCGGACMAGGHVWQGGICGRGTCMAGGMHGGEVCVAGVCVEGETATAVDGTHPTGMHSFFLVNLQESLFTKQS